MPKVKIRGPLEVIFKSGVPYVRETITWDGEPVMGTPIEHGPFRTAEEASHFLGQRAIWQKGYLDHLVRFNFNPDMPPYPEFEFNPEENGISALLRASQTRL